MHESMLAKLGKLQIRLSEIEGLLIDSETIKDMENYTLLNKEFADLKPIVDKFKEYKAVVEAIKDAKDWLKEQDTFEVVLYNGDILSVVPQNFVELEIVETDPGLKGDTAQGGSKPATLSTGAVVRVPLFIEIGEKIKVDTHSGEYVSRAK